jgi:hypothetical protein
MGRFTLIMIFRLLKVTFGWLVEWSMTRNVWAILGQSFRGNISFIITKYYEVELLQKHPRDSKNKRKIKEKKRKERDEQVKCRQKGCKSNLSALWCYLWTNRDLGFVMLDWQETQLLHSMLPSGDSFLFFYIFSPIPFFSGFSSILVFFYLDLLTLPLIKEKKANSW